MYKKLFFNLARNSLRYIIRTYGINRIYIPYYLCDEIRYSIAKENCRAVFYHIDDNFFPLKEFDKNEFVLYPDYFGICGKNVETLCSLYPKMIIDNSHSFYSAPKGLACFNSARKFIPVYNGSVLWIKKTDKINSYKTEQYKTITENNYNKLKTEIEFKKSEPAFISKKLIKQICMINNEIERKQVFCAFHEKYKAFNLIKPDINNIKSPFCYPLLLKDEITADEFAERLINEGNEILRYWSNLPKTYREYKFFRNLIPVPLTNKNPLF